MPLPYELSARDAGSSVCAIRQAAAKVISEANRISGTHRVAVVLSVLNPKDLLLAVADAATIAQRGISRGEQIGASLSPRSQCATLQFRSLSRCLSPPTRLALDWKKL
jgi:hypothetical protein